MITAVQYTPFIARYREILADELVQNADCIHKTGELANLTKLFLLAFAGYLHVHAPYIIMVVTDLYQPALGLFVYNDKREETIGIGFLKTYGITSNDFCFKKNLV